MYNKVSKSLSMTGPEKYYIMYGRLELLSLFLLRSMRPKWIDIK